MQIADRYDQKSYFKYDEDVMYPQIPARLRSRLYDELHRSGGRSEGFHFAIYCDLDPAAIRVELDEVKEIIQDGLASGRGAMAEGASPRLYKDGYISALTDALAILDEHYLNKPRIRARIYAEQYAAGCRNAGFSFALKCDANPATIRDERDAVHDQIRTMVQPDQHPSLATDAYLDVYRVTLTEILEIIDSDQNSHPTT